VARRLVAAVPASIYTIYGFRNHFTLFGSAPTQRIVSVTPDAISAQAFSAADRRAACSLFALTVRQDERP
jgi:hypothetical protein